MSKVKLLRSTDKDFNAELAALTESQGALDRAVIDAADEIIAQIRKEGDAALLSLTNRFDQRAVESVDLLNVKREVWAAAKARLPSQDYQQLELAADRIRWFHEHQKQSSWSIADSLGNRVGQRVLPLDSVGVYVPGGKASYPSSVLMNTIPAKVAGVQRIVMVTPAPNGVMNDWVLAAAELAGVDELWTIGGAQAVAALAYGTESIRAVDKIVGPGNAYVAAAKRAVFGRVGIDMIAGPSEVLIITDGSVNPDWIAMDMFAQCEHDEMAQAIVICDQADYFEALQSSIDRLLPTMTRAAIIEQSLSNRSAFILTCDLSESAQISNQLAPEHLELAVSDAADLLEQIKHAGAIFLGAQSTEAVGDYCAGPNHVLPTSGTAKFSSPLGVYDFEKRSSVIDLSVQGATALGHCASLLAEAEGLDAHAESARYRISKTQPE